MEAEGKIGSGLTFRGLRNKLAPWLADAGADDQTIASITGHKNVATIKVCPETRDRRKRADAAIQLIGKAKK